MTTESSMSDPYDAVLADLRAQRDQIEQAIAAIERVRGLKGGSATVTPAGGPDSGRDGGLEHGAFFGMSIPVAAKKLLAAKKRNLPNAEIVSGLEAGGLIMQSDNKMNTINTILTRRFQEKGDIVRVSRGMWGLREWHPNIRYKPKGDVEEIEEGEVPPPNDPNAP